jgi:hypothetical protein
LTSTEPYQAGIYFSPRNAPWHGGARQFESGRAYQIG